MGANAIPRTLILTHLRDKPPFQLNLERCTKLWELRDPAFGGIPFKRRVSLTGEGSQLPNGLTRRPGDLKIFSFTGAIDDRTIPPEYEGNEREFHPAVDFGFAGPGYNHFVLGGGNVEVCLLKTFVSLVREKTQQGERLEVLIPLMMVYFHDDISQPEMYVTKPNHYSRFLERALNEEDPRKLAVDSYSLSVDGRVKFGQTYPKPAAIELHWFTTLKGIFSSPFFPETRNNPAALKRLIDYFSDAN